MEVVTRESIPKPIRKLSDATNKESEHTVVRVSLYLPSYRSSPSRRWKQAKKLLDKAEKFLSAGLETKERSRWIGLLQKHLESEQDLARHPDALAFAYFHDGDQIETQPLLTSVEPLVVVAPSFHVVPLLRSIASEPHYRLIIIEKDTASIYRRDHEGLKAELKVSFPQGNTQHSAVLHPRETSSDLNRIWHNTADFSHALLNLQSLDPRPIALFGEDRLRRILIEDIRTSMTRPIFLQDRHKPVGQELTVKNLVSRADEAFADRVANQPPFDPSDLIAEAQRNGRYETDLAAIYQAALLGRVEQLFVSTNFQRWGSVDADSGSLEFHNLQNSHLDDCLIDDTVEVVLSKNGKVIFMGGEKQLSPQSASGVCAVMA